MDTITINKEVNPIDGNRLQLLDCRWIECYPKEVTECIDNTLSLDMTGEYLLIGTNLPKQNISTKEQWIRRQYGHRVFTENVPFLMQHTEEILRDSRKFLAPVSINNGLAYMGTSGFNRPTLGVYLEWWLHHADKSVDNNGNHVWFISGSPLSGNHCCSSVNKNGEQVKSVLSGFMSTWSSFTRVNKRYDKAKAKFEAYTFEEVLLILHGKTYQHHLYDLKQQIELDAEKRFNSASV